MASLVVSWYNNTPGGGTRLVYLSVGWSGNTIVGLLPTVGDCAQTRAVHLLCIMGTSGCVRTRACLLVRMCKYIYHGMCMYIYIYIYVNTHIYVYICIYLYTYIYTYTYICSLHVYRYVCIDMCVCVCVRVCVCLYLCLCL